MKQPKKLHPLVEYSGDIFVPEIDIELDDYVTVHNENLISHKMHENLDADHIGESVFIIEDTIDPNQFEENKEIGTTTKKPSLLKRIFN